MARTIGKKNINLVKKITLNRLKESTDMFGSCDYTVIEEQVVNLLDSSIWDTWESSDSEIRRIIHDTISERGSK